jgi:CheY-like chemotaxis protein
MIEEIKPVVLMADDDEDDCFLAKEAFLETGAGVDFSCVMDGVELMAYLSGRCRSEARDLPRLILLDLNMPRKDGREALREIKAEPVLRDIPIVIFTTSKEEKDIDFAKTGGAESFITKPAAYEEWIAIIKSLIERWLC